MNNEVTILIADDDDGHAALIGKNLRRAGLRNPTERFADGQEALDFLFSDHLLPPYHYVLLLDIRMPKVDGIEVLRRIRESPRLRRLPVIILTTTDDPREVDRCHELGCSSYVVKPVESEAFMNAIRQLGLFLSVTAVPHLEED